MDSPLLFKHPVERQPSPCVHRQACLFVVVQAVEAIKILSGIGDPLSRRLLLVDTLSARFHTVKLRAR